METTTQDHNALHVKSAKVLELMQKITNLAEMPKELSKKILILLLPYKSPLSQMNTWRYMKSITAIWRRKEVGKYMI